MTSISDEAELRRVHVDDPLTALPLIGRGPVVDVGSGGGSPGLPLAAARPDLRFELLESSRRKCAFLADVAEEFPNVGVVCARAEEHGRGLGRDAYETAVVRALAPPPVALEWCLPLVAPGGVALFYVGEGVPSLEAIAGMLGGGSPTVVDVPDERRRQLVIVPKEEPTPARFPRRPGMARKRPLA